MKNYWWKIASVVLLIYTFVGGLLLEAPRLNILQETIRNLYFHVPMWFGMMILLTVSVIYSIKYLRNPIQKYDDWAIESANTGLLFGALGILTGMVWAKFTWGSYWSNDPKQNAAAIAMLIYSAYVLLRNSLTDPQQKGKISAIYNIFAFATYIPLIYILPRLTNSLHPGAGGNPGFNAYDLDAKLRLVFYPAVIAWTFLGIWISSLRVRVKQLAEKMLEIN